MPRKIDLSHKVGRFSRLGIICETAKSLIHCVFELRLRDLPMIRCLGGIRMQQGMRRLFLLSVVLGLLSIFLAVCRTDSSIDTSLFSVEEIDGVRYIHNHAPQRDDAPGVELELRGKIGELEGIQEEDILYDPVDVARLKNGDILILERDGCCVKRYDRHHKYISSFGQKGQGPGDFISPFCLRLSPGRNKLYVADSNISFLSLDGGYYEGFTPEAIAVFGSIGVQYKTSGMAVLSGSRVILPSHPSVWVDSGEHKLLSIYDKKGKIIRSFGAVERYDNPELMLNANIVHFAKDDKDNIYVAYGYQNRVDKYSAEGGMIFSADRYLPYEVKNEIRAVLFKSGDLEREFPWPSVSSVTKGIHIDRKNRIWVLTFLKQPNKFLTFDDGENLTDCYEFDVFDPDGILLFEVPFPNVRFDNFSIYDDRMYIIDSQNESCVYEYRLVEKS